MECKEALRLLWEYLDQELGPEDAPAVKAHLIRCSSCYPVYCCDRKFLDLLARQRERCTAPPTLVFAIRAQLKVC
jgi:anti-sigma factor (TIGR02949 family)